MLQDIEHRNDKPHVFCVTIIWWHLEADDCGMDAFQDCISTLIYVADHAERHDLTPVTTFDQPLWWKSLAIKLSQPEGSPIRRLILRLGAFHMYGNELPW